MVFSVAFDPVEAVLATVGGLMIAVASSIAFVGFGRITGISGIYNSLIHLHWDQTLAWKLSFITGLLLISLIASVFFPTGVKIGPWHLPFFDSKEMLETRNSLVIWVIGAVLVGLGTRLGSGCTSGHGICGLPRLAPRSFVAVGSFMTLGIITASFLRPNVSSTSSSTSIPYLCGFSCFIFVLFLVFFIVLCMYETLQNAKTGVEMAISAFVGALFGLGLLVSGMARQSKILGFLTLGEHWDPSLAFVMLAAVGFNLVTFQFALKSMEKSISGNILQNPMAEIDWKLITGSALFGIGWGLTGFCPGPALVNLFRSHYLLYFFMAFSVGQTLSDLITNSGIKGKVH